MGLSNRSIKRPIIVLLFVIFLPITIWLIPFIATVSSSSPPKPEITRGEFPFKLEYELNNERIIIEDTVIVQYAGINHFSMNGKYRKWNQHLASNKKEVNVLLLQLDDGSKLYYNVGDARYYMEGGKKAPNTYEPFNSVYIEKPGSRRLVRPEELLKDFGIQLIEWEESLPIENSFK